MICDAIARQVLLEFDYDGAHRVVEPHCYGISSTGRHVLRAYQIAGQSAVSGELGWKLFDEAKMLNSSVMAATFEVRPKYNPDDRAMPTIICRI